MFMLIKRYAWAILVFLLIICFGGVYAIVAKSHDKSPNMSIELFLEQYEKGTITRVEIFYFPWTVHPTAFLREDDLFKGSPTIKIVGIVPYPHFTDVKKLLEGFTYKKAKTPPPDFRLGYIFHSVEKETFTLSLAKSDRPILSINGEMFEATPEIVMGLMRFLPVNAYEKMYKAMMESGFLPQQMKDPTKTDTQVDRRYR